MRSPEQEMAKAVLADRIATISDSDFIEQHVFGCLPEYANGRARDAELSIETVQNDGTGAATVAYTIDGSQQVFAKLFKDELGPHSYSIMCGLWEDGFDGHQPYQVPEPLFFMEEHNLLMMRAARGTCLADHLGKNGNGSDMEKAAAGVGEAAQWLLRLHASSVRFGSMDQPWYVFGKLSDRLSKAAATHPAELKRLTGFIDQIRELAGRRVDGDVVQVHGQYRPIHVFLGGEAVTVIDLDRSLLGDPAKDLAEFIHRMRTSMIRGADGDTREADAMSRTFLSAYAAERPENLRNLPFFRAFHIIVSLCRHMKKLKADDPELKRTIDFYSAELADVVSGKLER